MKRMLTLVCRLQCVIVLGALMFAAACTQAASPTAPSGPVPPQWSSLTAAQIVDWASVAATRGVAAEPFLSAADAPGAPANLAFTVSGTTVILTWSAPSSSNATSYVLEAGTSSGVSNIANFDTGGTATTLTVTRVPPGTYFVRVRARNSDGAGGASNEVIIVIAQSPCPLPSAPTGLSGTGGSNVTLSWIAVTGATSYIIEAGSASGAANLASFDTGSAATSFSAAAPQGTYYVRIRAQTACGTTAASNEVVVVVTSGPPPPLPPPTQRWIGVSPDGMIADPGQPECPIEWDLEMNLSVSGTSVTGTATTRNRRVQFSTCGDVFGFVANYDVRGTVDANGAFSFALGTGFSAFAFSGNASTTRMTGRFIGPNAQRGSFAATRQ